MRKTVTSLRCVPRYGYPFADVRTVDLDIRDTHDEDELRLAVQVFFSAIGVVDALYDIDVDDDGYFAIINDDAYREDWGDSLL